MLVVTRREFDNFDAVSCAEKPPVRQARNRNLPLPTAALTKPHACLSCAARSRCQFHPHPRALPSSSPGSAADSSGLKPSSRAAPFTCAAGAAFPFRAHFSFAAAAVAVAEQAAERGQVLQRHLIHRS